MKEIDLIFRDKSIWHSWIRIGSASEKEPSKIAIGIDMEYRRKIASPARMAYNNYESFEL